MKRKGVQYNIGNPKPKYQRVGPGLQGGQRYDYRQNIGSHTRSLALKAIEYKYMDTRLPITTIPGVDNLSAWPTTSLMMTSAYTWFRMLQGTDDGQRMGKKIMLTSIKINGYLLYDVDTDALQNIVPSVRVVMIQDNLANGISPVSNIGDVFTDNGPLAFRDIGFLKKFEVLKEKLFQAPLLPTTFNSVGTVISSEGNSRLFKIKRKWPKGKEINFNNANSGAYGSLEDTNIYLAACHTDPLSNIPVRMSYVARVGYYDL